MEEMNRRNDQGLGLPGNYIMLFLFCTELFLQINAIFHHRMPSGFVQCKNRRVSAGLCSEVPSRFELENKGFADHLPIIQPCGIFIHSSNPHKSITANR